MGSNPDAETNEDTASNTMPIRLASEFQPKSPVPLTNIIYESCFGAIIKRVGSVDKNLFELMKWLPKRHQ
jgi:hypothetical protein